MTHRLRTDKPYQHWAVAGALAGVLAVLMLSTAPAVSAAQPTQTSSSRAVAVAQAGIFLTIGSRLQFHNEGTNPRWTNVVFSTTEYYSSTGLNSSSTFFYLRVKTNAELNAMAEPPPDPFTVTVTATMTNDEGQTATGTFKFRTDWAKPPPPPGPVLKKSTAPAPAGAAVSAFAEYLFNNAGAGANFTAVSFSTMDYYVEANTGLSGGILDIRVKTSEELNAMASPPPNPFTVAVTLTVTNNAGQIATGTVDYITHYEETPRGAGRAPE